MPAPQTVALLLAATVLAALVVQQWSQKRATLSRLRSVLGTLGDDDMQPGLARALQWLGSHMPGASDESLRGVLMRAGYFHPSALHLFVALRLVSTIAVFGAVLVERHPMGAGTLTLAAFLAFFCSRLFVIVVKLQAERRERFLRRELPPLVDVLLMVLNSGISIDQCLRYVTGMLEQTAPLSNVVLKRYVADIDSGMPFEAAFLRMGQRFGIDEGYDLANLVKQALLQGGEIMASLESFGAELADKRAAAAREQIGRKSVVLTLVMLMFFMPVLLIALGAPAVSRITKTLDTVKHDLHNRETHR